MPSLMEQFHPNPAFAFQIMRVVSEGADPFECWRIAAGLETFEDWQREWTAAGDRWFARAREAAERGDGYSARTGAFQAHFFYRQAEFFLHESTPDKLSIFE